MDRRITHGMYGTKVYRTWAAMLQRCYNPKDKFYKLTDMGECPEGFVLDRIDNDGDYEPGNCRWIDKKTSAQNSRHVKLSMEEVREIRRLYPEGYTQREIAKRFNVSRMCISLVVNNKTWN